MSDIKVEHVSDICGGYYIAHCEEISVVVNAGETPAEAIERVKNKTAPMLIISFSGGRTSGYMAKWCLDNLADKYSLIFIFMNTGAEDQRTLDFVNKCDIEFGLNLIWLEADIKHGERVGTKYKVVDFASASRECEPFYEMIKKYGIPNKSYPHCNRELKLAPFEAWMKDYAPDAWR